MEGSSKGIWNGNALNCDSFTQLGGDLLAPQDNLFLPPRDPRARRRNVPSAGGRRGTDVSQHRGGQPQHPTWAAGAGGSSSWCSIRMDDFSAISCFFPCVWCVSAYEHVWKWIFLAKEMKDAVFLKPGRYTNKNKTWETLPNTREDDPNCNMYDTFIYLYIYLSKYDQATHNEIKWYNLIWFKLIQ